MASSVTLAWDPSPANNVVGYTIYYGFGSGIYSTNIFVGNTTNATVSDLVAGSTYYFAATATDTSGLESEFSNEVSYTVPTSPNTNAAPVLLTIQISPDRQVLLASTTRPGAHLNILTNSDLTLTNWAVATSVSAGADGTVQFVDPVGPTNQALYYRAQVVH